MGFPFLIGLLLGGLSVFYVFLAVAAFSQEFALLINASVVAVLKDVVGPVSAGFGGAIAGAYSAYYLQRKNEEHKERRVDHLVVHGAAVQLSEMLKDLLALKKFNICPFMNSNLRFLGIPKSPISTTIVGVVEPKVIDVLLSRGSGAALSAVLMAASSYRVCCQNLSSRNKELDDYNALMQKAGLSLRTDLTICDILPAVGAGRLLGLYDLCEDALVRLDEAIANLQGAIESLSEVVESQFRKEGSKNIKFTFEGGEEYFTKISDPFISKKQFEELIKECEGGGERVMSWS
ncbi:hypothetical protein [Pseudomonas sp. RTCS2]|uniref:hypothetical protein n=1 Tax=Pseudomonas sp. RTCS2 TaxID=3389877 RepID=UPI0039E44228